MPNPNPSADILQYGERSALKELPYTGGVVQKRAAGRPAAPATTAAAPVAPTDEIPPEHLEIMERYMSAKAALAMVNQVGQATPYSGRWLDAMRAAAEQAFLEAARRLREETPVFDLEGEA